MVEGKDEGRGERRGGEVSSWKEGERRERKGEEREEGRGERGGEVS